MYVYVYCRTLVSTCVSYVSLTLYRLPIKFYFVFAIFVQICPKTQDLVPANISYTGGTIEFVDSVPFPRTDRKSST